MFLSPNIWITTYWHFINYINVITRQSFPIMKQKKTFLINSVEFIWSVAERIAPKDKLNSKVKIPFHAEISWISCVASDWCQNVTSVTINVFFIDVCDWFSRSRDTSLLICHFNTKDKIKQENEIMSVIRSGCCAFVDKQNSIFDWISYKPNATENAVFLLKFIKKYF